MKSFQQFIIEQYLEEKGLAIPASIAAAGAIGYGIGSYRQEPKLPPSVDTSMTASVEQEEPQPEPGFSTLEAESTPKPEANPEVLKVIPDDAGMRNKRIRDSVVGHVKETEGFRDRAYQDSAGVWTIGYGSTYHYDKDGNIIGKVKPGDRISTDQAEDYIHHHVQKNVVPYLSKSLPNIFDSKHNKDIHPEYVGRMITFAYNVGHDALINSKRDSVAQHLIKANQTEDPEERKKHLMNGLFGVYDFHKADGMPIKGLVDRRHKKVMGVLSSMGNDGYISKEDADNFKQKGRLIYNNILSNIGE